MTEQQSLIPTVVPHGYEPPAEVERRGRHNLTRINKMLKRYGLAVDPEMETIKIKSLWRYLLGWKGGKR